VGRIAASLAPSRAREAALWAASIYAVNYLVGRDGHFAVSDTALCLGIALTLLACVHAAAGKLAWLPWAGFFAGCSFGTKYSAIGLAIPSC
jgi:4-amino-4-deoxy-L-arabinose transferase-like glycosyltransferase